MLHTCSISLTFNVALRIYFDIELLYNYVVMCHRGVRLQYACGATNKLAEI